MYKRQCLDCTLKIWSKDNWTVKKTLRGHIGGVTSLCLLLNGDYLASGSRDKTIKIWNTNDWSLINTLKGHNVSVSSLIVVGNGDLVSGSDDRTIKIWNTNNWTLKRKLQQGPYYYKVTSLAYIPSLNYLASGSDDRTIYIRCV